MNPREWGPPAWQFLHAIPAGYPDQPDDGTRLAYRRFYESLGDVLPCPGCRRHYQELWLESPITEADLASGEALRDWTDRLHQKINHDRDLLHGPPPPEETGIAWYWWVLLVLVLVMAVVAVGYCYLAKQRRTRILKG